MATADLTRAEWKKATRSAHNGGCVEIAANLPGIAAVRDSKRPESGALTVTKASFGTFLTDTRNGRHDL